MHFIQEQFLFLLAVSLVFFLPGFALLRSFFKDSFTSLELFVFSLPTSIAIVNFLMIIIGRAGIKLTATNILITIIAAVSVCVILSTATKKFFKSNTPDTAKNSDSHSNIPLFTFQESWLIILILALTVFIKTVYLADVILPTATDLGHHMYWSKSIATTGELPTYVERNIIEHNGTYELAAPEPIDDFIIGEHLTFAAIALIAGLDFISAFPILVLLLINIFSLLAVFLFVLRAFSSESFARSSVSAKTVAIVTLFFLGPLYTLASPQAKFVSGGVIGNTLGNLFIPIVLYTYWRALREKSSKFLTLAFFLTFGLAYIHHLSTLIFLFVAIFTVVTFSVLRITSLPTHIAEWFRIFFRPAPLIFAIVAAIFFFFILAPSYADPKSLNTALGAPTKATRTGLTFLQLTFSTGEGRLGLGIAGLLALLFFSFRKNTGHPAARNAAHNATGGVQHDSYTTAFFFAWGFALLLMSLRPNWLFLDIPSNRISTYAIFPFAVLSALAFTFLFKQQSTINSRQRIESSAFVVILTFFITGGFYDNSQSLLGKTKAQEAIQTYRVSDYLAQHNQPGDLILKDHNYIVADSWMKLSFLKGYTYPLSRGLLRRYEDETKPREMCTLRMIAVPNTDKGIKCFDDTGTNIVVVNPHFDSAQFEKSDRFTSVYRSNDIAIYIRNNQ